MSLLPIILALVELLIKAYPIIEAWIINWRKRTQPQLTSSNVLLTPSTPKEFTDSLVHELTLLSEKTNLLRSRYYKFLARMAPKFSDQLWDKFYSAQPSSSFDATERVTFDEAEAVKALELTKG